MAIKVVLTMVRRFGALLTVTVTSFRKVFTIALSFVAFAKPFSMAYIYGGILVLAGVYINTLSSSKKKHHDKDFRTILGAKSGVAPPTQV